MKWIWMLLLLVSLGSCQLKKVVERDAEGRKISRYRKHKKTGEIEGRYKGFHESGGLALIMHYKKGKLDGPVKTYYPNGQLESLAYTEKDRYEGKFQYWYSNGQLKQEGQYLNGDIEGPLKSYYPNGKLKEIVEFSGSVENGAYTLYYQNGKIKEEGHFLKGPNMDGLIKQYDAEGQLLRKQSCSAGSCETIWERKTAKDEE